MKKQSHHSKSLTQERAIDDQALGAVVGGSAPPAPASTSSELRQKNNNWAGAQASIDAQNIIAQMPQDTGASHTGSRDRKSVV